MPLCIKDLENAKGFPTTQGGCPLFGEQVSSREADTSTTSKSRYSFENGWRFKNKVEDAPYVQRLKDAGPIIIGKTNSKSTVYFVCMHCNHQN